MNRNKGVYRYGVAKMHAKGLRRFMCIWRHRRLPSVRDVFARQWQRISGGLVSAAHGPMVKVE